jgi:hypothetical protein
VAKDHARFGGERPSFEQRIFHAGGQLHSAQRIADHRRTHALGAQLAQLINLQEVREGICVLNWKQAGFFPAGKLPRSNMKDP